MALAAPMRRALRRSSRNDRACGGTWQQTPSRHDDYTPHRPGFPLPDLSVLVTEDADPIVLPPTPLAVSCRNHSCHAVHQAATAYTGAGYLVVATRDSTPSSSDTGPPSATSLVVRTSATGITASAQVPRGRAASAPPAYRGSTAHIGEDGFRE